MAEVVPARYQPKLPLGPPSSASPSSADAAYGLAEIPAD